MFPRLPRGCPCAQEWLEAQKPLLLQARETAMAHAASLLAALLEWKKQIEPLLQEQLKVAQKKAIEMSLQAAVDIEKYSKVAHQQLLTQAEAAKPHVEKAKVWADEQTKKAIAAAEPHVKNAYTQVEPHIKPVQAWAEETGTKLAPVVEPVGKAMGVGWVKLLGWLAEVGKQLEPHVKVAQKWALDTLECMCLPIQQQLVDYKAAKAAGEEYPPPVYAESKPATVVD